MTSNNSMIINFFKKKVSYEKYIFSVILHEESGVEKR